MAQRKRVKAKAPKVRVSIAEILFAIRELRGNVLDLQGAVRYALNTFNATGNHDRMLLEHMARLQRWMPAETYEKMMRGNGNG